MKWGRIYLALLMFTAIILRSLPDTVFDFFHEHTHTHQVVSNNQDHPTIHEETHACHLPDWNFESLDVSQTLLTFYTQSNLIDFIPAIKSMVSLHSVQRIGRAPPVMG